MVDTSLESAGIGPHSLDCHPPLRKPGHLLHGVATRPRTKTIAGISINVAVTQISDIYTTEADGTSSFPPRFVEHLTPAELSRLVHVHQSLSQALSMCKRKSRLGRREYCGSSKVPRKLRVRHDIPDLSGIPKCDLSSRLSWILGRRRSFAMRARSDSRMRPAQVVEIKHIVQ